jgi:actin
MCGNERFRCGEILFDPQLLTNIDTTCTDRTYAMDQMIYRSLMNCDHQFSSILMANIVLSGGNTILPGLAQRLTSNMTHLLRSSSQSSTTSPTISSLTVNVTPSQEHATYIGASIMASLSTFKQLSITKQVTASDCPLSPNIHSNV